VANQSGCHRPQHGDIENRVQQSYRKRRQLGLWRLADLGNAAPDQRLNRGVGPDDRGENLPAPIRRFDIAEADSEMPLAVLIAPDEGRIRVIAAAAVAGSAGAASRTSAPTLSAQGLWIDPGIDRQKVFEHTRQDRYAAQ
jgi:hypothetical protein